MTGLAAADFPISEDGAPPGHHGVCRGRVPAGGRDRPRSQLQHGRQGQPARRRQVGGANASSARCGQTDQVMVVAIGGETDDRRAAVDRSRRGAGGDRSSRRLGHDAAVRRGARRARRDPAGARTPRAGPAVGRHRSIQRHDGRGSGRSARDDTTCSSIRWRVGARAAGVRRARGGDRRPLVFRARAARWSPTMTAIASELRFQYLLGLCAVAGACGGAGVARDRRRSRSPGRSRAGARRILQALDAVAWSRVVSDRRSSVSRNRRTLEPETADGLEREPHSKVQQPPFQRRVALAAGDEVGHHRADRARSACSARIISPVNAGRKKPALSRAARASSGDGFVAHPRMRRRARRSPAASASPIHLPDASAK